MKTKQELKQLIDSDKLDSYSKIELLEEYKQRLLLEKCRDDYKSFIKLFWDFQATSKLNWNFGIEAIIEHMEAIKKKEIFRLIINIPPRNGKSSLTSISFPPYMWITNPREKFFYLSYNRDLCSDNIIRSRNIINSEPYNVFVNPKSELYSYSLAKDQNAKSKIFNNKSGHLISATPNSGSLGKGFTVALIDDLSATDDPKELENANNYYTNTLRDRADNAGKYQIVIIMQKLGYGDLTDYVLERYGDENWTRLIIPLERDIQSNYVITNWKNAKIKNDPRQIGEPLDDERYPPTTLQTLKIDSKVWETKYQQRNPKVAEVKDRIDPLYFVVYNRSCKIKGSWFEYLVIGWDTATEDTPDANYTVGTVGGLYNNRIYIFDMLRGQYDLIRKLNYFKDFAFKYKDKKKVVHHIEKANIGTTLAKYYTDLGFSIEFATTAKYGDKNNKRILLYDAMIANKIIFLDYNPFGISSEKEYDLEVIRDELCNGLCKTDDIIDSLFFTTALFVEGFNMNAIIEKPPKLEENKYILTEEGYKDVEKITLLDNYDYFDYMSVPKEFYNIPF